MSPRNEWENYYGSGEEENLICPHDACLMTGGCYCEDEDFINMNYDFDRASSFCLVLECYEYSTNSSYCTKHTYDCLLIGCPLRIAEKASYCCNHRKVCAKLGCNNRISDGIYTLFCIDHKEFNCSTNGCYQTVKIRDSYCSNHSQYCQNSSFCYNRVANYQTYCNSCQQQQNEQTKLKSLVKTNTSLNNPLSVDRFSTNWNNNLATVVNDYHWVFLLVLDEDKKVKVFPINSYETKWGESSREQHGSVNAAQKEANWLQNKLKYDSNPILVIHPRCDSYRSFSEFVREPYVKFYNSLPYNTSNWDNYLKPLSVIRVRKRDKTFKSAEFYHVGIYIGNNQVCHIFGYDNKESSMEACITHIDTFLGDTSTTERCGEVDAYRPIIPFGKNISQRIAWAEEVKFRKGEYDLFNRNCAHFAHMAVFLINYCDQSANESAWRRFIANFGNGHVKGWKWVKTFVVKPWWWTTIDAVRNASKPVNNGKGQSIKLVSEISETSSKIKELNNVWSREIENRYQAKIEQPVKVGECRIM
jgi:hypothetical protein